MLKYSAVFIPCLFIVSCTKVLDLDINEPSGKLVLYPILSDNRAIIIKLSAPAGILSENFPILEDGKVVITRNGEPADTVLISPDGSGVSEIVPLPGEKYEFSASATGYPTAYCEAVMPYPVEGLAVDTSYNVYFLYQKQFCVRLKIKDDPSTKNFYRTTVYLKKYITTTIIKQTESGYIIFDSSYVAVGKPELYSNIPDYGFFSNWEGRFLLAQDQIDITEGQGFRYDFGSEVYYQGREYFFSDELLNGKDFSVNIIVGGPLSSANFEKYIIEVSSISEDYYNGVKSYARYGTREYSKLPYSEEVSIFSSVMGGYGFPLASSTIIDSSYVMPRNNAK